MNVYLVMVGRDPHRGTSAYVDSVHTTNAGATTAREAFIASGYSRMDVHIREMPVQESENER